MNSHDIANSSAFDSTGILFDQHHFVTDLTTLDDIWTYTWNDRNEMTGFREKNSSGTVIASGTYTYDSLDRRIGVDETSGGTTTQTWIVYNGNSNSPYAEFNGSGTHLERYLAGPTYVPGVTGMIARTNASGVTDWYLTGKLGSVRDIVNTSGTVTDHIAYGAFGSIRAETNPSSGSQFKFDGMQYDTITGLCNDWHRLFSSSDGRFISIDPTSFNSSIQNLYEYASNNSLNIIDQSGFQDIIPNFPPIPSKSSPTTGPPAVFDPSPTPAFFPPPNNSHHGDGGKQNEGNPRPAPTPGHPDNGGTPLDNRNDPPITPGNGPDTQPAPGPPPESLQPRLSQELLLPGRMTSGLTLPEFTIIQDSGMFIIQMDLLGLPIREQMVEKMRDFITPHLIHSISITDIFIITPRDSAVV
jgi:RHS repeat-associated protein